MCHIESSRKSTRGERPLRVRIVINHLATTRKAQTSAISTGMKPTEPGLDTSQLDGLLDITYRVKKLQRLTEAEVRCADHSMPVQANVYKQRIVATSIKVAEYLGILFNWDENKVCFQERAQDCSRVEAKTIALEIIYAIAYRIQEMMKTVIFEADKALLGHRNPDIDPATISCALWIIYSSLNEWQKLSFNAAKALQGPPSLVSLTYHNFTWQVFS